MNPAKLGSRTQGTWVSWALEPSETSSKVFIALATNPAGLYPEQISDRLTSMGTQKNAPKKQKVKLLGLMCSFAKRKFNETHKDFSIQQMWKDNFQF